MNRQNPVPYRTVQEFRSVCHAMRRYGRYSVGHKMKQRKAVAMYLADREVRG